MVQTSWFIQCKATRCVLLHTSVCGLHESVSNLMNQSTNIIGPCVLIFIHRPYQPDTSLQSIVDKASAIVLDVQVFSFNGTMHWKIYKKVYNMV